MRVIEFDWFWPILNFKFKRASLRVFLWIVHFFFSFDYLSNFHLVSVADFALVCESRYDSLTVTIVEVKHLSLLVFQFNSFMNHKPNIFCKKIAKILAFTASQTHRVIKLSIKHLKRDRRSHNLSYKGLARDCGTEAERGWILVDWLVNVYQPVFILCLHFWAVAVT